MPVPKTKDEAVVEARREHGGKPVEGLDWLELVGGGHIFTFRVVHGPIGGMSERLVQIRFRIYTGPGGDGATGGVLHSEWVPEEEVEAATT